ncbi:DHA2 family efflux MFS transporter permease subunit [Nocardia brasiliensis]|uniref:DHA2 family efflux MFS transporter permease subunit n=1 Tax=Nocardia brasiliensis TaxID=37326 RepID=UPI003D8B7DEA
MTSTPTIPSLQGNATVALPIDRAFAFFTESFGSWWPTAYHIGGAEMADGIIEPRVGGRWYEVGTDGVECDWGRVLEYDPPNRLVVTWQINGQWQFDPDTDHASEIEVRFSADGPEQTTVTLEHRHIDKLVDGRVIHDTIAEQGVAGAPSSKCSPRRLNRRPDYCTAPIDPSLPHGGRFTTARRERPPWGSGTRTDGSVMSVLDESGPATRRRWAVCLASVASFMVGLDVLVIMTAVSTLRAEFGAGAAGLAWTVNAYEIGFAALIITGSALGDRFGRRLWFVLGIGIFTIGSIWCALSSSIEMLIAARAFQGLGGGIALALALAVITAVTPPADLGSAFGVWGAVIGVAVTVGPLVGGAIIHFTSWHWCFWVNVPVGLTVVLLSWSTIDETKGNADRLDPLGVLLSTAGVVALAYALLRGGEIGWTSPSIGFGLCAGVVLLVAFVWWQHRSSVPMLPLRMFANRSFAGGCGVGFVLGAALYGSVFLLAQYLQLALGSDPLIVGVQLLPLLALAPVVAPIAGKLADRVGERPIVVCALVLMASGLFAMGQSVRAHGDYRAIVVPMIVAGIGIAALFPVLAAAVMRSVELARLGMASGVSNTLRQVGAVLGMAIGVAIFTRFGGYGTPRQFVDGFAPAITALAVFALIGIVPASAIRRYRDAGRSATPASSRRAE